MSWRIIWLRIIVLSIVITRKFFFLSFCSTLVLLIGARLTCDITVRVS